MNVSRVASLLRELADELEREDDGQEPGRAATKRERETIARVVDTRERETIARVVAMLRERARHDADRVRAALTDAADAIDRGDWRGEP